MNYTILSIKQSELLEKLIVKYGQIQTSMDILKKPKIIGITSRQKILLPRWLKTAGYAHKNGLCHFGFKCRDFCRCLIMSWPVFFG